MFSIFDKKASAYANPFFFAHKGQALRALEDVVADSQSQLYRHPEDFTLYHLGEFDDATGAIKPIVPPVFVEEALTIKAAKSEVK